MTTVGMFLILLMGAIVTTTESGDGCGNSWPLCYGEILPSQPEVETMIEYSHRVVSGLLGIMVIILAIWTWPTIGHLRETKLFSILSVFFIVFQGLLGAAAVIWGQSSAVLALHFGISLLSLASVFILTVLVFEHDRLGREYVVPIQKNLRYQLYALFLFLYIVVYSGALVRHTETGLACAAWPFCNEQQWMPDLNSVAGIPFLHRLLAFAIFIWITILTIQFVRKFQKEKIIVWSASLAFLFVILQIASGALVVLTRLNIFLTLAHGFFISCLFVIISYLLLLASRQSLLAEKQRQAVRLNENRSQKNPMIE